MNWPGAMARRPGRMMAAWWLLRARKIDEASLRICCQQSHPHFICNAQAVFAAHDSSVHRRIKDPRECSFRCYASHDGFKLISDPILEQHCARDFTHFSLYLAGGILAISALFGNSLQLSDS